MVEAYVSLFVEHIKNILKRNILITFDSRPLLLNSFPKR